MQKKGKWPHNGQKYLNSFSSGAKRYAFSALYSTAELCSHCFLICSSMAKLFHPSVPKQLSACAVSPTATQSRALALLVLFLFLLFLFLSYSISLPPTNPRGLAGKPNWFNYIVLIRGSCLRIEGNCTTECTVFSSPNGRLGKWRQVQIYPCRLQRPQPEEAWN